MRKNNAGLTLIELLIALGIVSIMSVVAVSVYSPYVKRGRRLDAINSILSISLAEEQYRSSNSAYGSLAQVWGGVTTSSEGYYTLTISNVGASSYTITATAIGTQASDQMNGTSCAAMQFIVNNGTITKSPTACWPS